MAKLECKSLLNLMYSVTAVKGTGIYHTDQGQWGGRVVMEIFRPIYHTAVRCACKGMGDFYWKAGDNVLKEIRNWIPKNDHAEIWNAEGSVIASWRQMVGLCTFLATMRCTSVYVISSKHKLGSCVNVADVTQYISCVGMYVTVCICTFIYVYMDV